jgi:hypothetical protein
MTSDKIRELEDLSEHALREMFELENISDDLLEKITSEAMARHEEFSDEEIDELLENFVHSNLLSLKHRFLSLFSVRWNDNEIGMDKLSGYISSLITAEDGNISNSDELDWPWPISDPMEGTGGSSEINFEHVQSGLNLCGYQVGKTKGLEEKERARLLSHFFTQQLPNVVEKYHGDDYGDPGSECPSSYKLEQSPA